MDYLSAIPLISQSAVNILVVCHRSSKQPSVRPISTHTYMETPDYQVAYKLNQFLVLDAIRFTKDGVLITRPPPQPFRLPEFSFIYSDLPAFLCTTAIGR